VQGIAFDQDGTAYAAELGLNAWDELNVLRAGADYGRPPAECPDGREGERPIFALRPAEASPSDIAYAAPPTIESTFDSTRSRDRGSPRQDDGPCCCDWPTSA
jgi:hypothetical protein